MSTKIQIKHRFSNAVIFECDAPGNLPSGFHTRHALESATKAGADLSGANLSGADLSGAKLSEANLSGAGLSRADLSGADLSGANLSGANLSGADLSGANLYVANLSGANLYGAGLSGAGLSGADLSGANLSGADLSEANLSGAGLSGANLSGEELIGDRPVFQIGPIGSRCSYFIAYLTDRGIKLRAGCFFGTVQEFRKQLAKEHGTNDHATEYEAALALIQTHAELWAHAA